MKEPSPLEELAEMVLAAKANREAAEEELNRTPGWRFRRRARRGSRVQRRLEKEQNLIDLLQSVSRK